MPGEDKQARCPKGERRDKKTKKCVKVGKAKTPSPKKNTVKANSPKKSLPKNTRKSPSPKKSPSKANIPYMSTMKELDSRRKQYMESILVEMANAIAGKSPIGKSTYYYINLYTLNRFLQQEINNIQTKHESRGYFFSDPEYVISQLQRLKTYFKHIANAKGHVDTNEIAELYRK
jgi:hypothetical protein